ncbi:YhcH/YjgK/YiaL family protein [Clostridium massiliamazoniense]|uniref:YhcH/YjgK/YiaL family protein n=1 Tax=Clostridium massiliamazoniense TaxID=1347366 RepID=UPI0006D81349|nr:YhcH/YjgK/YiaL family protein [Clostridium massiliamazoniense]
MIFNNLNNISVINELDKNILRALDYAISNNLIDYKKGTHDIDGKDMFFNRVSYGTKEDSKGFWEGHRDYIDIHVILDGKERINYNLSNNLKGLNYDKEGDFASFEGRSKQSLILEKGDFAIFYPEDIHMTGLIVDEPEKVEKVIFKVKLNN